MTTVPPNGLSSPSEKGNSDIITSVVALAPRRNGKTWSHLLRPAPLPPCNQTGQARGSTSSHQTRTQNRQPAGPVLRQNRRSTPQASGRLTGVNKLRTHHNSLHRPGEREKVPEPRLPVPVSDHIQIWMLRPLAGIHIRPGFIFEERPVSRSFHGQVPESR